MLEEWDEQEFEQAMQHIIRHEVTDKFLSTENPRCTLIVGQPGAGKSRLVDVSMERMSNNAIWINGDIYRKFHPNYKKLHKQYGDNAVYRTQKFAGKMTEALIEEMSNRRYNLIIEGTLRTTQVPLNTKRLLESKGYDVSLSAILVRPEVSYLSTIKRYAMMKAQGLVARKTPKEHHDTVVRAISDNLAILYKTGGFSGIQVYDRQSNLLYDSAMTPYKNPADLFREEFERKLSKDELEKITEEYKDYVPSEEIEATLTRYQSQR